MFIRLITQTLLTLSLIQFIPVDGAMLERAAKLPIAGGRSLVLDAMQLATTPGVLLAAEAKVPQKVEMESLGVVTTARSVLVVDRTTGIPLYSKNSDAVRPIGSISKLMTALVFLETKPNLDAAASVLPDDIRDGGRIYLATNDPVTTRDLLHASLVGSDNTATMSLVRLSGLSEDVFLAQMNAKAIALGMKSTTFYDPTGLAANNVSTARDIINLLEAAQQTPDIQSTITMPSVTITQGSGRTVTIETTDDLLGSFLNEAPYHMLGGKTGYLPEAGYCMGVGVRREGAGDIYVVILGSDSKQTRVQEVKGLAAWVYRVFKW